MKIIKCYKLKINTTTLSRLDKTFRFLPGGDLGNHVVVVGAAL